MAIGEILSKQVAVLKMDASQFKAEAKSAGAVEQAVMKERLAGLEKQNAALERTTQRFQLYAAAGAAAWSLLSTSVQKYEEHLKKMGTAGEAELAKLQRVTGTAAKAQENLQFAIARLAIEAEPAVKALASMADSLAKIVSGIGAVVEKAKQLPGAGAIGWGIENLGPVNMIKHQINAAEWIGEQLYYGGGTVAPGANTALTDDMASPQQVKQWQSQFGAALANPYAGRGSIPNAHLFDQSAWLATQVGPDDLARVVLRDLVFRAESVFVKALPPLLGGTNGKSTKGAVGQAKAGPGLLDQFSAFAGEYARREEYLAMLAEEVATGEASFGAWGGLEGGRTYAAGSAFNTSDGAVSVGAWEGDQRKARESRLEKIFGPLSDFDAYASGFQMLQGASQAAFAAWIDGSMGAAEAFKKFAADALKAEAVSLLGTGLASVGKGIVHLAGGNPQGAGEIAAGGKAIATAAVIGGLAKALGGGSGAGAGASGSYAAAGIGGGGDGGQATRDRIVVFGAGTSRSDDDDRWRARRMRRELQGHDEFYPPPDGGGRN